MPNIITIHGPMAAGKSTLTELVRKKFPTYSYVDRPFIKRGLKPAGKKDALRISKLASYFIIEKLVELGKDIIVQEVNPESLKNNLGERYLDDNGYTLIPFFIKCGVDTAVERDKHRFKTPREESVRKIHSEYVSPSEYEIVIDTEKLSLDESFDLIIKNIP